MTYKGYEQKRFVNAGASWIILSPAKPLNMASIEQLASTVQLAPHKETT